MKRLWTIMKKELFHIWRDPLTLGLILALPAMLLVLLGYGISGESLNTGIGVVDLSRSDASRPRWKAQLKRASRGRPLRPLRSGSTSVSSI